MAPAPSQLWVDGVFLVPTALSWGAGQQSEDSPAVPRKLKRQRQSSHCPAPALPAVPLSSGDT